MAQESMYKNMSAGYRRLLIARDTIAVIAIMTIIPILAVRFSGIVMPTSLSSTYYEKQQELRSLEEQRNDLRNRREDATIDQQREMTEQMTELDNKTQTISKEVRDLGSQLALYRFYSQIIIGVVALLSGIFIPLFHAGIGLLVGGIITLGYGYYTYWEHLTDLVATISLVIALIGLIAGMAYYGRSGNQQTQQT